VDAASRKYFGHPAARLSLSEAAELAGALPFPLRSNPAYRPGRMLHRQQLILLHLRGAPVEIPPDTESTETADSVIPAPTLDSLPPLDSFPPVPDSLGG
jgi:penicillin-binding protein 1A